MPTTHIAYEITTGRILVVHHFAAEPTDPEITRQDAVLLAEPSEEQVAVISVADEIEAGRPYRVDVDRKVLVEAEAGEGVRFAITSSRPEGAGESP